MCSFSRNIFHWYALHEVVIEFSRRCLKSCIPWTLCSFCCVWKTSSSVFFFLFRFWVYSTLCEQCKISFDYPWKEHSRTINWMMHSANQFFYLSMHRKLNYPCTINWINLIHLIQQDPKPKMEKKEYCWKRVFNGYMLKSSTILCY